MLCFSLRREKNVDFCFWLKYRCEKFQRQYLGRQPDRPERHLYRRWTETMVTFQWAVYIFFFSLLLQFSPLFFFNNYSRLFLTRLRRLVKGAYHFFSTELLPFPKKKQKNIRCMFRSISCKFS